MRAYEIVEGKIIFDDGINLFESDLNDVIENLESTTGLEIRERDGYLYEFAEYAYDDYSDGHGLSAEQWFKCDLDDVMQAVMMSNYRILEP